MIQRLPCGNPSLGVQARHFADQVPELAVYIKPSCKGRPRLVGIEISNQGDEALQKGVFLSNVLQQPHKPFLVPKEGYVSPKSVPPRHVPGSLFGGGAEHRVVEHDVDGHDGERVDIRRRLLPGAGLRQISFPHR